MPISSRKPVLIVTGMVLLLAIIHLAVGIGITSRYGKYSDIFRLSVGISAFNIVIGVAGLIVGFLALFAILTERAALAKKMAIGALVLAVFAIASFIAGLVINSQSINYIQNRLTYRMSTYSQSSDSMSVLDSVQTDYECCGANLWLDWSRISLGASSLGGASSGAGGVVGRRRRGHNSEQSTAPLTPLGQAMRQKRQFINSGSGSNIYNLPTTFTFPLPGSCCTAGTASSPNTVGTYCLYNTSSSTSSFYVQGCLPPVANVNVSQVTGIVVINTCLGILSFVFFALLIATPQNPDPNDPNGKQTQMNGMDPQQQMQQMQQQPMPMQYQDPNQAYNMNNNPVPYAYNNNPPAYYYGNNPSVYATYQ